MPKPSRKRPVYRDPPEIAEIRRIRARMWKEAGGTPEGFYQYIQRVQDEMKAAGVEFVTGPSLKKKATKRGKAAKQGGRPGAKPGKKRAA